MVELNVYQNNNQTSEFYKKWYARTSYKEQIDLNGLAKLQKIFTTFRKRGGLMIVITAALHFGRKQSRECFQ